MLFSFLVIMTSRDLSSLPKQNKSVDSRSFRFRKHNIVSVRSTWSNFQKQQHVDAAITDQFFKQIESKKKISKAKNNEQTILGFLHPLCNPVLLNCFFFVFVSQGLQELHSSWRRDQYSSFGFTYASSRYCVTQRYLQGCTQLDTRRLQ